jgi:NitT/TauT family transport system substrate-binding protein
MTRFTGPMGLAMGVIVCAGLTLTGCGSSGSSTGADTGGSTSSVSLKVAVSPTISSVDVLYALNAGIFKKYGLNVTTSVDTSSGASTFAEVLNGQLDMTVVDPMSTILAISKGLPLQIAAEGNVMSSDPSTNYTGIMVKSGSGITSVTQLEGKTVAVVSLDSILQMLAQITVDAGGGDAAQVKFVEVPPGEEVDAVAKGQTDAFVNVEPLLTKGKAAGLTVLAHPPASLGGLPQDVLVTSKTFAQQNPSTVKKFQEAMAEANEALAADPSLIVTTAIAQKEVPAAVADKIILPVFAGGTVSAASITTLENLMIKYGYLKSTVSASALLGSS